MSKNEQHKKDWKQEQIDELISDAQKELERIQTNAVKVYEAKLKAISVLRKVVPFLKKKRIIWFHGNQVEIAIDSTDSDIPRAISKNLGVKFVKTPHGSMQHFDYATTIDDIPIELYGAVPPGCKFVERTKTVTYFEATCPGNDEEKKTSQNETK